jgi:hypothetical protein
MPKVKQATPKHVEPKKTVPGADPHAHKKAQLEKARSILREKRAEAKSRGEKYISKRSIKKQEKEQKILESMPAPVAVA